MASWNELPDPHAGDDLAYAEAWENRIPDVEYAGEDEAGQLGLGVPGEQRAIPTLAAVAECQCSPIERIAADNDPRNGSTATRIVRATEGICNSCGGRR